MSEDLQNWVSVADASVLTPGNVMGVKVGDLDIALYNIDGQIYATHNVCSHALALLSDGWLDGDVIECPLHGGRFEVKTGRGLGAPIMCDIKTVPIRNVSGKLQVNVT